MVALGKDQGELSMTELCLIAVLGPLSFCMNVFTLIYYYLWCCVSVFYFVKNAFFKNLNSSLVREAIFVFLCFYSHMALLACLVCV